MATKEFNAEQFLADLGVEPGRDYTADDFLNMSDHELKLVLVGTELSSGEQKSFEIEWNKRFD